MERPSPVEMDSAERIINDMADFYSSGLKRLFNLVDSKASCHNNIKQERHNDVVDPPRNDMFWREAAIRLGEELLGDPAPEGYYQFGRMEWLQYMLRAVQQLKNRKTSENNNISPSYHLKENKPPMTLFYTLYAHRDHLLLIDYMLNNIKTLTNMPYSIQLAKELKEATSAKLKEIEENWNPVTWEELIRELNDKKEDYQLVCEKYAELTMLYETLYQKHFGKSCQVPIN